MTPQLHPDTLPFLQELTMNNNRPWFNDHKDCWLAIKADFEAFTQALIDEMAKYDDTLVGLTAKNSVYRIYRDTRFSADKTPYKTHIACFLSSWGPKNSGVPGYYFQLGTEEAYGLKGTCNLGGGIFMPETAARPQRLPCRLGICRPVEIQRLLHRLHNARKAPREREAFR